MKKMEIFEKFSWKKFINNRKKNQKVLKLHKIRTIIGIVKVTLSNNNHKWPTCRRFWRCRKYKMMCRYGQRLNQVHNHHLTISIYQINRTDSARVFYQTTKFDKQQTSTFSLLSRHPHVCKATSYRRQVSTDGSVPSRRTSVKPSKTQSGPVQSRPVTSRAVERVFSFFQIEMKAILPIYNR